MATRSFSRTEKASSRRTLPAGRLFYEDLLDQISDGVYLVSRERRITYWNGGAERITGYGAEHVLGQICSAGILRHVDDTGRQLYLDGCPLAAVMKDGNRVAVNVRGQALRNPTGKIVGSVEVFSTRVANPYAGQRRARKDDSLDPVTGLPPRRLGELHLQTLMQAVSERAGTLGVSENSWIQKGENQVRVTVSVGATMAEPTETADDLVDRADTFMYASKKGGRNRVPTDSGELTSKAGRPILGTSVPWKTPRSPGTRPD